MSRPSAAIELSGLEKRYRRGKTTFAAVRPTTLSVPWGQVIGLLGPNGAGKTTTIKMICGLVTPTTGTVMLGGHDVARKRSLAVRQIGAVLEGSRNVYWPLSAWENLMYFGRLNGLASVEVKPRAQRLLTDLGLWERRNEPVGSFSRGMQRKVAIAAALITDPPILLLDEPPSAWTYPPHALSATGSAVSPATKARRSCCPPTSWRWPKSCPTGSR